MNHSCNRQRVCYLFSFEAAMRDFLRWSVRVLLVLVTATLAGVHRAAGAPGDGLVQVDLNDRIGRFAPIYPWFGYDEANYTTMPHGIELLHELQELSPVPIHIRVHHLLTSGDGRAELKFSSTNIYSEDSSGRPVYQFAILDGIFDVWRSAGVRPVVELGFMPRDLAAVLPDRHEPYQVHFPSSTISGASNNPPKDYG